MPAYKQVSKPRAASYNPVIVSAYYKSEGLPAPVFEHRFHPSRKWRFDIAWPERRVAVEVEGGIWTQGRHTRASGYNKDREKYNTAAAMGWQVLRYAPCEVCMAETIEQIKQAMDTKRLAPLPYEDRGE